MATNLCLYFCTSSFSITLLLLKGQIIKAFSYVRLEVVWEKFDQLQTQFESLSLDFLPGFSQKSQLSSCMTGRPSKFNCESQIQFSQRSNFELDMTDWSKSNILKDLDSSISGLKIKVSNAEKQLSCI